MSDKKFFIDDAAKIVPPVNDTPYKRIFAVGDVHGCFDKLMNLFEKISATDDDYFVFLGDYVDRGQQVGETLKWVFEHGKRPNYKFLRGNHEQMMLTVLQGGNKIMWLFNGGRSTLRALGDLKAEDASLLYKVVDFADKLPLYHKMTIGGRQYVFCHAGIDSRVPLNEQKAEFLLWARDEFFDSYDGDALVIGGHSPVQAFARFGVRDNPRPIKLPDRNILLTDTGSYVRGGKISAVDILSGEYFQSDCD